MKNTFIFPIALFLFTACRKPLVEPNAECKFPFVVPKVELQDSSFPVNQHYDLEKVKCITDYCRTINEFPYIKVDEEKLDIVSDEEITKMGLKEVEDLFYEVQSYFFDSKKIELVFANNVGFSAEYGIKKIAIDPKEILDILSDAKFADPKDVLRYVLAHEISHYIHEISTHPPISNKVGYTLHGNISIYQLTLNIERDNNDASLDQNKVHKDFLSNYFASHAEVDVFTATVLTKNGFKGWEDAFHFIDEKIEEEGINADGSVDFLGRKKAIQKVVKALSN